MLWFVLINCALVLGPVAGDNMPGGVAQTFFNHMTLNVRRNGWIEEDKTRVGFELEVIMRKTKVGEESHARCSVPFRFDGGVDMIETYIREGLNKEVISQAGPWYQDC